MSACDLFYAGQTVEVWDGGRWTRATVTRRTKLVLTVKTPDGEAPIEERFVCKLVRPPTALKLVRSA